MSPSTHSDQSPNVVLFLSGDLMFAGRVEHAAKRCGWTFRLSGNLPEAPDPMVRRVILDLSSRRKLVASLMSQVETVCPQAEVIAYGPHVQVETLRDARRAGIPTVLTRGQFDGWLGSWGEDENSGHAGALSH